MNPTEITAGNKLIADAVGKCDFVSPIGVEHNVYNFNYDLPELAAANGKYHRHRVGSMQFHCSWEWLMYAVMKLPELYKHHYKDAKDFILHIDINEFSVSVEISGCCFTSFINDGDSVLAMWYSLKAHFEAIYLKTH